MSGRCGTCDKPLPTDADFAKCKVCKIGFHLSSCSTVSDSSWKTMGERRQTWKCPSCRNLGVNTKSSSKPSGTPEPKERKDSEKSNETDPIMRKLDEKFDTMQKHFDSVMEDFKKTLTFYGGQIEDLTTSLKLVEQKNVKIEKELEAQKEINTELKTRVRKLETIVEQKEQREKNNIMEITGFKDNVVDEKLFVRQLMEKVGATDVQVQVKKSVKPPKDEKPGTSTIYVHFQSEEDRNNVLSVIKQRKLYDEMNATIQSSNPVRLFFNEVLTPYYKSLFYEARRIKSEKNFAYLWIKNGKILLKKTADSQTQVLSSKDDIGRL
uniref:FP protein C-terminal domain-containing protein n=1 Tax=Cacopsylla melanoneura TaxID=428564 RepID=A0A8D9F860_9HEMI